MSGTGIVGKNDEALFGRVLYAYDGNKYIPVECDEDGRIRTLPHTVSGKYFNSIYTQDNDPLGWFSVYTNNFSYPIRIKSFLVKFSGSGNYNFYYGVYDGSAVQAYDFDANLAANVYTRYDMDIVLNPSAQFYMYYSLLSATLAVEVYFNGEVSE